MHAVVSRGKRIKAKIEERASVKIYACSYFSIGGRGEEIECRKGNKKIVQKDNKKNTRRRSQSAFLLVILFCYCYKIIYNFRSEVFVLFIEIEFVL